MEPQDFGTDESPAWCPGCGNFSLLNAVKKALAGSGKSPHEILMVSGIGQAAKLPHYVKANCFNGLHGRALPAAMGAKLANRELTVLVTTGDGDCYGEGGNHLIHAIRRNIDITVVVHDNQVYGLTKGQASPTTDPGVRTRIQSRGVVQEPFRPLELALALGAGFVARGFTGDQERLAATIMAGMAHRGFALIDVLQPCVTFNKTNTFAWYKQRVRPIDADAAYDPRDLESARRAAREWGDRIPIGILYCNDSNPSYEEKIGLNAWPPLVDMPIEDVDIAAALGEYR